MSEEKFLVVKGPGGGGLGDRIRAVLVAIQYAKLSGRTLFVDWSDGIYGAPGDNVFDALFCLRGIPVSESIPPDGDVFPPAWQNRLSKSMDNVYIDDGTATWNRQDALRRYSFDFGQLHYPQRTLVSWDFDQLDSLRQYLPDHLKTADSESIQRQIYRTYLRPNPELSEDARKYLAHSNGRVSIGVHARVTNEAAQQKGAIPLERYFAAVDRLTDRISTPVSIILATDNSVIEAEFRKRYESVFAIEKWFAKPGESLHLNPACPDRFQAARHAIIEILLLADCDHLISVHNSSFSLVARIASGADSSSHTILQPTYQGKSMIKSGLKQLLGPRLVGALDYYRFPELRRGWGGPLNGQLARQCMVRALLQGLGIDTVVETGTHRGTSTEYFAALCAGHVFTIEADERFYGFSRVRLLFRRNVVALHNDSRLGLKSLIADTRLTGKRILFYLDAHWGEDLPLAEELELIFAHWPQAVVLIDDFQVPDDPGYGFDDYGPGKALTLNYTQSVQNKYALSVFFPASTSGQETGAVRGCVCLVADAALAQHIDSIGALRRYHDPLPQQ